MRRTLVTADQSPRLKSTRDRGFTFFELLVVLTVVTLVLSALPGVVHSILPGLKFESWSKNVATESRRLRAAAIASGQETMLQIDLNEGVIRAIYEVGQEKTKPPPTLIVPSDVSVVIRTAARDFEDDGVGYIRFFPDGSSSGGRIVVSRRGETKTISIEWLTGLAHVR